MARLSRRALLQGGSTLALMALVGCRTRPVASVAIHPAIGVARLGNAPSEWFFGPEVPGGALSAARYRDQAGALARQAARFRLFALDEQGHVIREVTNSEADITWSVHLANR